MASFDYDVAIIGSGFALALWPNKGDVDMRPPLGSGYERVEPVMPHRPVVPAGAPGELRYDAVKEEVVPAYPY
jgi:cholesterol oxidase